MAREAWENDWANLDRRTRGRLRRAAFWGRAVDDPDEAELVAAFARSKATYRRGQQLAVHLLVIAAAIAGLVLNLIRGRDLLVVVFACVLVVDLGALAVFLGSRRRLLDAAERNERSVSKRA